MVNCFRDRSNNSSVLLHLSLFGSEEVKLIGVGIWDMSIGGRPETRTPALNRVQRGFQHSCCVAVVCGASVTAQEEPSVYLCIISAG